jgi:hypothetical protein
MNYGQEGESGQGCATSWLCYCCWYVWTLPWALHAAPLFLSRSGVLDTQCLPPPVAGPIAVEPGLAGLDLLCFPWCFPLWSDCHATRLLAA